MSIYKAGAPSWWKQERERKQQLAEAEAARREETARARRARWRRLFMTACRWVGYALAAVAILIVAVTGLAMISGRARRR